MAIVNGTLTEDYPAVVAVEFPQNDFTGIVISDHIVLTAAHGVDETVGTDAVNEGVVRFGSSTADPDREVGISDVRMHRYYDVDTARYYDIALVALEESASVAPVPMHTQPLTDADVPGTLRVVGFGISSPDLDDYGVKRLADMPPTSIEPRTIAYSYPTPNPHPNLCFGDSGGPHLLDVGGIERIVGVTKSANCINSGSATPIYPYLEEFIYPTMDRWEGPCRLDDVCVTDGCRTPDPDCDPCGFNDVCAEGCPVRDLDCPLRGLAGEYCSVNLDCESNLCVEAPDVPGLRFCALPCAETTAEEVCGERFECLPIAGFEFDRSACLYRQPTPRPPGWECTAPNQCASGACDSDSGVCVQLCDDATPCPQGFDCIATGSQGVCLPEEPPPGGCGCSVGGHRTSGWTALLALALALCVARQRPPRRRRHLSVLPQAGRRSHPGLRTP